MDMNSNYVTTGKPKVSGCAFRAPLGTPLPTDATTKLSDEYKSLGYISEDGVNIDNAVSKNLIKAWGGDVVIAADGDKGYKLSTNLIESLNQEVQKVAYGDANVKPGEVTATGEVGDNAVYVIERVTKGGKACRLVVPEGAITAIGTVTYKDDDAVAYPITLSLMGVMLSKEDEKTTYFKEYYEQAGE